MNKEQKTTSGWWKELCCCQYGQSEDCMPRDSKDHEVELAIMWKRNSKQRWGFCKGNSLKPCLANYIIFYKLVYIEFMHGDMH